MIDMSRSIDTFHSSAWNRIWRDCCGRGPRGEIELGDLRQTRVALLCGLSLRGLERVPGAGPREERFKRLAGVDLNQRMILHGVRRVIAEKVKLLDASDDIGLAGIG